MYRHCPFCLAWLTSIPAVLYEAAREDANQWRVNGEQNLKAVALVLRTALINNDCLSTQCLAMRVHFSDVISRIRMAEIPAKCLGQAITQISTNLSKYSIIDPSLHRALCLLQLL